MEEKYYLLQVLSPYVALKGQLSRPFISTIDNLQDFGAGLIKKGHLDRYLLACEDIDVLFVREVNKADIKGIIEAVETSKGTIKIIYTELLITLLYGKTSSEVYVRGYYAEFKNLAKVTRDGYIPIDKSLGWGNIEILEHNKRTLIKRGAIYIHNQSKGIMAFVDCYFENYEEMLKDYDNPEPNIELSCYLECILYE